MKKNKTCKNKKIFLFLFIFFNIIEIWLFSGYNGQLYKIYLMASNNIIEKEKIPKINNMNILKEKTSCTKEEKEIVNNTKDCIKLKVNNNILLYSNGDITQYNPNYNNRKNIFHIGTIYGIEFIDNKYIYLCNNRNSFLLNINNLELLDSFGKEEKRWIRNIYYDENNKYLYLLSTNSKTDINKLDKLQIKDNKLKLIESIEFYSFSSPRTIEYVDDDFLFAESEVIVNIGGYGETMGIEKYNLNYWRNRKND